MATAKKTPAKKAVKKTLSAEAKLLKRLNDLLNEGQITLECEDAREAFADLQNSLGLKQKYPTSDDSHMQVNFSLTLDYVEVDPSLDPSCYDAYKIILMDAKGNKLFEGEPDNVSLE